MATVTAPYPSKMDEIYNASIVEIDRSGDRDFVTLKNRVGDPIMTTRIRNAVKNISKSVRRIGAYDYTWQDILVPGWYASGRPNEKLANPGTLPPSWAMDAEWSPCGRYLAITSTLSPYFQVYKRSGDALSKLTNPGILPFSAGSNVAWSPDGQYLLVSLASSNHSLYQRSGDTFTLVTSGGSAFSPVPSGGKQITWSSDGMYVAFGALNPPYLEWYKRNSPSATTFTRLTAPTQPDALNSFSRQGVLWSPDGTYLAVATGLTPYVALYKRDGDALEKLTMTSPAAGVARSLAWSLDGKYLAVGCASTPYLTIYRREGDELSKLTSNIVPEAANAVSDLVWSPDGRYLAGALSASPYQAVWEFTYDEKLYKLPDLAALTGESVGVSFSPDGRNLVWTCTITPFIAWYKTANLPIRGAAVRIDADKPYPG